MLPRASQMSRRRPRGAAHGPFVLTIPHRQTSLRLCVSAGISTQSSQSGRAIAALGERAIHMAFGQLPFVNNYHRRLRGMAGTQGRRDTETQGHRDTGTQGRRDAGTQGHRDAGTQGHRDAGTDDYYWMHDQRQSGSPGRLAPSRRPSGRGERRGVAPSNDKLRHGLLP